MCVCECVWVDGCRCMCVCVSVLLLFVVSTEPMYIGGHGKMKPFSLPLTINNNLVLTATKPVDFHSLTYY